MLCQGPLVINESIIVQPKGKGVCIQRSLVDGIICRLHDGKAI